MAPLNTALCIILTLTPPPPREQTGSLVAAKWPKTEIKADGDISFTVSHLHSGHNESAQAEGK